MAKTFELRVKVEEVTPVQEVGTNGFKKSELIGVVEGEYPEYYKFEFVQSKAEVPQDLIPGTYVNVSFNIKGKKVESKKAGGETMYFATLAAWKVEA